MPNPRMKHRRVVHRSTAGILKPIPEAVDPVGNPPPGLTTNTVAPLYQRGTANHCNHQGTQIMDPRSGNVFETRRFSISSIRRPDAKSAQISGNRREEREY